MKPVVSLVPVLLLAACAGGPSTVQRGWIGGRYADVSARGPLFHAGEAGVGADGSVVGMPANAGQSGGALVTEDIPGSPLHAAGLRAGDLVLSAGDRTVLAAADLRAAAESAAPGTSIPVRYWRGGDVRDASVVAGRETLESSGSVTVGLQFGLVLDLWPFDDGINILNLVRVRRDDSRADLDGPRNDYLRAAGLAADAKGPMQEAWDVFVVPVGFAKGKRAVKQERVE